MLYFLYYGMVWMMGDEVCHSAKVSRLTVLREEADGAECFVIVAHGSEPGHPEGAGL